MNLLGFISYFCFILLFTIHTDCLCSPYLTAFKVKKENEVNSSRHTIIFYSSFHQQPTHKHTLMEP